MTREEAIEVIYQSLKNDTDMAKLKDAIKTLKQKPKWIDVNERLPKDGGTFIISYEEIMASGYVFRGVESMGLVHGEGMEWIDNLGRRFESNYRKVKAWMPLPEPYKAEEDKE